MHTSGASQAEGAVVRVGPIGIGPGYPLCLIAGPCVLEGEELVMRSAERLARIASDYGVPLIFKASFEKDNRSGPEGYRGPGLVEGLALLEQVRQKTGLPILSDVHRETDVRRAAEVLDVVQIPAFLCRQTSLLVEAGSWCRVVNLKKGQFVAPEDMAGSVAKVRGGGDAAVLLTERGACFGYNRLVADMTSIPIMQAIGCPVVFDATHIVRRYGIPSSSADGGRPEFIETLARAGVAAGCDALFVETHPCPSEALCDAASMQPLDGLPSLLDAVLPIAECVRRRVAPDPYEA